MKNILAFLCAALLGTAAGIFYGSMYSVTAVADCAMEPNYLKGEHVLLQNRRKEETSFQRGEVVLMENTLYQETGENSVMLKRIVGLPGEKIAMEHGHVYINGNLLHDTWTNTYNRGTDTMDLRIVPQNSYFVLGDNRRESTDSRDETVGMIEKDEIIGKVIRQW